MMLMQIWSRWRHRTSGWRLDGPDTIAIPDARVYRGTYMTNLPACHYTLNAAWLPRLELDYPTNGPILARLMDANSYQYFHNHELRMSQLITEVKFTFHSYDTNHQESTEQWWFRYRFPTAENDLLTYMERRLTDISNAASDDDPDQVVREVTNIRRNLIMYRLGGPVT